MNEAHSGAAEKFAALKFASFAADIPSMMLAALMFAI
jgi:hypothetical protein